MKSLEIVLPLPSPPHSLLPHPCIREQMCNKLSAKRHEREVALKRAARLETIDTANQWLIKQT